MRNLLCFEWKRCLKGRGIKISLLLSILLVLGHFFTYCIWYMNGTVGGVIDELGRDILLNSPDCTTVYPSSLYEGFIGSEGITFWNEMYYYIIPVLAALPFGASYFEDEKSGYLKNILTRVKKEKFIFAKGVVTFSSGALAAGTAYVLSFVTNALYLPAINPCEVAMHTHVIDRMPMAEWYYSKPWLYFGVYLIILMLSGGFFAVFSLCISFLASNQLVIWLVPFLIYYLVDYFCIELGKNYYSLLCMINPARPDDKYYLSIHHIFGILGVLIFLVSLSYGLFSKYRKKIV